MSTPTHSPSSPVTASPEVTPEVQATAIKLVRTKTFLKNSFNKIGVPVLAGAASAFVVLRAIRTSEDDTESTDTDPTE